MFNFISCPSGTWLKRSKVLLLPISRAVPELLLILCGLAFIVPVLIYAGSTDPVTVSSLDGVAGQNSWYRSDIGVTLTASDMESGPAETTYWVDSDTPTTVAHGSGGAVTQFLNRSFESGSFLGISNWYAGLSGFALYYRSSVSAHDGNRSAAIAFIDFGGGDFYHWHNQPHSVQLTVGNDYVISAWSRAIMGSNDKVYFEIWGQNASGGNDTLIATSNVETGFSWSWRELTQQFTVPSGADYIYVKLGAEGSPAAIIYWDYVTIRNAMTTAEVNFTHTQEGDHTLHYFSEDNAGNVESEQTTALKKDTVAPGSWQNFNADRSSCNHCYETSIEVRDVTSGVDVSTAEYRYYTEHDSLFWGLYSPVQSVTISSNGQPAGDGETDYVTLTSPEIDFGDSSPGPFRLQYRIYDLAGNLSTSPVYEIASPWIQALDGSIYINGEISIPSPSAGQTHANADVMTGSNIENFVTENNWQDDSYAHVNAGNITLIDVLPKYNEMKQLATLITNGKLPMTDGIYRLAGNFAITSASIQDGSDKYDEKDISAVVIIEGDLVIEAGYTVVETNNTVFLVEGDLTVDRNAEDFAGFFIVEGIFDSDPSGQSTRPLTVDGSVLAFDGYSLSRDLGDQGTENNSNTPSEKFIWQPDIAVDEVLSAYLNNQAQTYKWTEVVR